MGGSRPDFVLRSSQGSLPAVAIFTDGWLYHASPAHNRIADDARKRQELRDSGVIVLGITARDVEHARDGTFEAPAWLDDGVIADPDEFRRHVPAPERGGHPARPGRLPALLDPEPGRRRTPGAGQSPPLHVRPGRPALHRWTPAADLAREAALRLLDPDRVTSGRGRGHRRLVVERRIGRLPHQDVGRRVLEVALVIDDRTENLADKDQAADGWREWLRISNALNLREQPTIVTALTEASDQGVADHAKPRDRSG